MADNEVDSIDEMVEGMLYVKKDDKVVKLDVDPEEWPRIRVSFEAKEALIEYQRSLRNQFGGFKPDVVLVASAALMLGLSQSDCVEKVKEAARFHWGF